ncbi:MAG: hypothetical protein G01um101416_1210 [Microgenomates group bacterium Gr01-1014_16]|nr:MAG: hypothetical protein G01um101416_1210 [Microgenomates group bacterium Gr01-1014_16]
MEVKWGDAGLALIGVGSLVLTACAEAVSVINDVAHNIECFNNGGVVVVPDPRAVEWMKQYLDVNYFQKVVNELIGKFGFGVPEAYGDANSWSMGLQNEHTAEVFRINDIGDGLVPDPEKIGQLRMVISGLDSNAYCPDNATWPELPGAVGGVIQKDESIEMALSVTWPFLVVGGVVVVCAGGVWLSIRNDKESSYSGVAHSDGGGHFDGEEAAEYNAVGDGVGSGRGETEKPHQVATVAPVVTVSAEGNIIGVAKSVSVRREGGLEAPSWVTNDHIEAMMASGGDARRATHVQTVAGGVRSHFDGHVDPQVFEGIDEVLGLRVGRDASGVVETGTMRTPPITKIVRLEPEVQKVSQPRLPAAGESSAPKD